MFYFQVIQFYSETLTSKKNVVLLLVLGINGLRSGMPSIKFQEIKLDTGTDVRKYKHLHTNKYILLIPHTDKILVTCFV